MSAFVCQSKNHLKFNGNGEAIIWLKKHKETTYFPSAFYAKIYKNVACNK